MLLLRIDQPGASIWSGDVDNRLKTLIDALTLPKANDGYAELSPDRYEDPFFCLLEDDSLLSRISVETDRLLDFPNDSDQSFAQVMVTVSIRPNTLTFANIGL